MVQKPSLQTALSLPCILVAEDDPLTQQLVQHMLVRLGYHTEVVSDGDKAVQAASKGGYAAILMDCEMPLVTGLEAAAKIRRGEKAAGRTPIIAMTGSSFADSRRLCLQAGMDDVLVKPVASKALGEMLTAWVGELAYPPVKRSQGVAPDALAVVDRTVMVQLQQGFASPHTAQQALNLRLERFCADLPQVLAAIERAIYDQDHASLEQEARQLNAAGHQLGLRRLTNACHWLELECLGRRFTDALASYQELRREGQAALAVLAAEWIKPLPAESA